MPDKGDDRRPLGGVEFPDFAKAMYANFVNVNHTPWDFRLVFAVVKAPMPGQEMQAAASEGEVHPQAIADIIIPANLMHGLISALQDNFSKYLSQYGPPGLDPEGPRPPEQPEEEA
jgi:hypothetical protein